MKTFSETRLKIFLGLILLISCIVSVLAAASDPEQQLNTSYRGKVLTLRHFYVGSHLSFTDNGLLVGTSEIGPWTVSGQLKVKDVRFDGRTLKIFGRRRLLFFDRRSKKLRDVFETCSREPCAKYFPKVHRGDWRDLAELQRVEIDIELLSETPDAVEATQAIQSVFLASYESLADIVPKSWESYLSDDAGSDDAEVEGPVYRAKRGEVSVPQPLSMSDPEYSEAARKVGYGARVKLNLIVDAAGNPRSIRIAQPAGLGLDEQSVAAVSQWKFGPGWKDGKPVAVRISAETSFRLF